MAEPQARRIKGAIGALYLIGGLNLALGLTALFASNTVLQQLVYPPFAILYGIGFLALGIFARRNAQLALLVGLVVFGLDTMLSLVGLLVAGASPTAASLVVRAVLELVLFLGWQAARVGG